MELIYNWSWRKIGPGPQIIEFEGTSADLYHDLIHLVDDLIQDGFVKSRIFFAGLPAMTAHPSGKE